MSHKKQLRPIQSVANGVPEGQVRGIWASTTSGLRVRSRLDSIKLVLIYESFNWENITKLNSLNQLIYKSKSKQKSVVDWVRARREVSARRELRQRHMRPGRGSRHTWGLVDRVWVTSGTFHCPWLEAKSEVREGMTEALADVSVRVSDAPSPASLRKLSINGFRTK